jgi:5-methyltetrahydrofolate--homocysteine methyltransferase
MSDLYALMAETVISGNIAEVKKLTQEALHRGDKAQTILEKGLLPGMGFVGERFKSGEMFIPEVLLSARTMSSAMDILRPLLSEANTRAAGTIVIGTVEGDIHNIGKSLVAMLLEGAGLKVIDLGIDVPSEKFVDAVKTHQPNMVGLSALLTTTMPKMKEVIESLVEAGLRTSVKVIVGGAPVTEKFAKDIGADGYAPNGGEAVARAKALMAQG